MLTVRSGGRERSRRRLRGDDGSSLMLMPAAVLIIIVLGAIAADLSHVHSAKRDLIGVANSVANDAVTYGVDPDELRDPTSTNPYPLDRDRVAAALARSLAVHRSPNRPFTLSSFQIDPQARQVTVTLTEDVEWIFAKSLPGTGDTAAIQATGTAVAVEG